MNPYHDTDMDFLDSTRLQLSSEHAGQDFDDLFTRAAPSRTVAESDPPCLSPSELSLKRSYHEQDTLRHPKVFASNSPAESLDNSSPSSSSESPRNHLRNPSVASSTSAVHSENTVMPFGYTSDDWVNPDYDHVKDESLFGFDASLPNLEGPYPAETDLESSNKAMDAAFDFESAASSPSPLTAGVTPQARVQKGSRPRMRGAPGSAKRKSASPVRFRFPSTVFGTIGLTCHSEFLKTPPHTLATMSRTHPLPSSRQGHTLKPKHPSVHGVDILRLIWRRALAVLT
jgi:hypothetical protein